jgi:hypothetical protein
MKVIIFILNILYININLFYFIIFKIKLLILNFLFKIILNIIIYNFIIIKKLFQIIILIL